MMHDKSFLSCRKRRNKTSLLKSDELSKKMISQSVFRRLSRPDFVQEFNHFPWLPSCFDIYLWRITPGGGGTEHFQGFNRATRCWAKLSENTCYSLKLQTTVTAVRPPHLSEKSKKKRDEHSSGLKSQTSRWDANQPTTLWSHRQKIFIFRRFFLSNT